MPAYKRLLFRRANLRRSRRGAILVVVLAIVMVVVATSAILVRSLLSYRRSMHIAQDRIQTLCLAESGLQRAMARLRDSADYRGETWQIAASEFQGEFEGEVVIEVQANPDDPQKKTIRVDAIYPRRPFRRILISRTKIINLRELGVTQ